jgi:hypothetical protein
LFSMRLLRGFVPVASPEAQAYFGVSHLVI